MRKLHYMAIVLSFIALSIIITSCSGCKVKDMKTTQKVATTPLKDQSKKKPESITEKDIDSSVCIIKRTIGGENASIGLPPRSSEAEAYPRTLWEGTMVDKDLEYANEAREIYPGVVEYREVFTEMRWDHHEQEEYEFKTVVPARIEFFDKKNNSIKSYDIRAHNPYLKESRSKVKVTENYNAIAEHYSYLPKGDQSGSKVITDQWVYAQVKEGNDHLPIVVKYSTLYVTEDHYIVDGAYTYVLLDTLGEEMDRISFPYQQLSGAAFTPDGRYAIIGFTGGETVNNAGIRSEKEGFELWDLKNDQLLHREINTDPNMWITAPSYNGRDNKLNISFSHPNAKNILKTIYCFSIVDKDFYQYQKNKELRNAHINYFDKNKSLMPWLETKKYVQIKKITMNYGK